MADQTAGQKWAQRMRRAAENLATAEVNYSWLGSKPAEEHEAIRRELRRAKVEMKLLISETGLLIDSAVEAMRS